MEGETTPHEQTNVKDEQLRFERDGALSDQFRLLTKLKQQEKGVKPDQYLAPTVYINEEALLRRGIAIPPDIRGSLPAFLQFARDNSINVAMYTGGIAWDGNVMNSHEATDNPHASSIKPTSIIDTLGGGF